MVFSRAFFLHHIFQTWCSQDRHDVCERAAHLCWSPAELCIFCWWGQDDCRLLFRAHGSAGLHHSHNGCTDSHPADQQPITNHNHNAFCPRHQCTHHARQDAGGKHYPGKLAGAPGNFCWSLSFLVSVAPCSFTN